jgi:hypothetical protein
MHPGSQQGKFDATLAGIETHEPDCWDNRVRIRLVLFDFSSAVSSGSKRARLSHEKTCVAFVAAYDDTILPPHLSWVVLKRGGFRGVL